MRHLLVLTLTSFALACAETPAPPVSQPASAAASKAESAAAPAKMAAPAPAPVVPAGLRSSSEPPPYQPPNEPWRKEQPRGGPLPEIKLPKAQIGKLKNGLEVILVETHHLPVVSAQLVVFAGAERVKPAQAGLPALVAALLTEGTEKHDSIALSDAVDAIGAELNANANYDGSFVSMS